MTLAIKSWLRRKQVPSLKNWGPGSGRRISSGTPKKTATIPPENPRASYGRRATATLATRDVPIRERRRSDRGSRRGTGQLVSAMPPAEWRRGGGRRWGRECRPTSLPDAHRASQGAKRGTCGVPGGVASGGRGRHKQFNPPLFIIPIAVRSDHRFRAGTLAFAPPSGAPGSWGAGPAFRGHEEGSDGRAGPTLSTTKPT
jgi:hypothetical protein